MIVRHPGVSTITHHAQMLSREQNASGKRKNKSFQAAVQLVCRHWRDLLLTMDTGRHQTMDLRLLSIYGDENFQETASAFERRLAESEGCDLNVKFTLHPLGAWSNDIDAMNHAQQMHILTFCHAITAVLSMHAPQLALLIFDVDQPQVLRFITEQLMLMKSAPNLHAVAFTSWFLGRNCNSIMELFKTKPFDDSFTVSPYRVSDAPSASDSQLFRFIVCGKGHKTGPSESPADQFDHGIFITYANITALDLTIDVLFNFPVDTMHPGIFPKLKTLMLQGRPLFLGLFLAKFDFPSIAHVSLQITEVHKGHTDPDLSQHVQRDSFHQLTELSIPFPQNSHMNNILAMFRKADLKYLEIKGSHQSIPRGDEENRRINSTLNLLCCKPTIVSLTTLSVHNVEVVLDGIDLSSCRQLGVSLANHTHPSFMNAIVNAVLRSQHQLAKPVIQKINVTDSEGGTFSWMNKM